MNFLKTALVQDLLSSAPAKPLVQIQAEKTTIEEALAIFAKHNILSVPVFNETDQAFTGVLDLYEILAFTAFATQDDENFLSAIDWTLPASDLVGTSGVEGDDQVQGLWLAEATSPINKPLEFLSKGVSRFLVKCPNEELRILSQSDMLKFFYKTALENKGEFEFLNVTVKDSNIATYPALTLPGSTSALNGIRKIRIHEVHTLAMVNADGQLIASFSETELRGLSQATLGSLLLPSEEFLRSHYQGTFPELESVSDNDTLLTAIQKLLERKVHHVWITEGGKPTGCLTMGDVLLFFWNNLMSLWTESN